jgi:hypothetical protein
MNRRTFLGLLAGIPFLRRLPAVQRQRLDVEQIARLFHVPPHMIVSHFTYDDFREHQSRALTSRE